MCTTYRVLTILLLGFGFSPLAAAQTYSYRLTEIPAASAQASAISNTGFVTGFGSVCNTCEYGAFLWTGNTPGRETFSLFGPVPNGYSFSEGYDVNYLGQVTGSIWSISGETGRAAFFWDGATKKYFGLPGGPTSDGNAINASGHVAGTAFIDRDTSERHAFLWDGALVHDLGTLGGVSSSGHGINAKGHVTGWSQNAKGKVRAFLWNGTSMRDLFTLGGSASRGSDVNATDQVVGESINQLGHTRAFLWQNGSMQDLGTLGGPSSSAVAINNAGQVVGDSGGHPFLWEKGTMFNVQSLIAATDPLKPLVTLNEVNDINNVGQMIAVAYGPNPPFGKLYLLSPSYTLSAFLAPTLKSWPRGSTVRIAIAALDANGARITDERARFLIAQPGCRVKVSATGAQSLASTCMKYNATTNEFWFDWKLLGTGTGTSAINVRVNYGAPGPLKVQKTKNITVTT